MFQDLLNIESDFIEQGISLVTEDALSQGFKNGYVLGQKKGYEIGQEIGFYLGCVTGWLVLAQQAPSFFPARYACITEFTKIIFF